MITLFKGRHNFVSTHRRYDQSRRLDLRRAYVALEEFGFLNFLQSDAVEMKPFLAEVALNPLDIITFKIVKNKLIYVNYIEFSITFCQNNEHNVPHT